VRCNTLHHEFSLSAVTRFLAEVGGRLSETLGQSLRHELSSAGNVTLRDLLSAAESNTSFLTSLVKDIVAFALMKSTRRGDLGDDSARFLVSVKDHRAIEQKAGRKCGGTSADNFRGGRTFVCGLLRLFWIAGHLEGDGGSDSGADDKLVEYIFFFESPLGILSATPLPTGYRRLLLNIRLENELLVGMSRVALCSLTFIRRLIFLAFGTETQFNLSSLFGVLGQ
jgi:hypothetical protein